MHKNNKHNNSYNFELLKQKVPALAPFVFKNEYGTETVDFGNSTVVRLLNTALLKNDYNVDYWEFPESNLTPPIPSRVEYIHYLNDIIGNKKEAKVLDIGTGANCIYPLLGNKAYNWSFVGSELSEASLNIAETIVSKNNISDIKLRLQPNANHVLKSIILDDEHFEASLCNPPFYTNQEQAERASAKKRKGLGKQNPEENNFSGKANELWCKGGEKRFINNYIYESTLFKTQCNWFTTLISNKEHIRSFKVLLKKYKATQVKLVKMPVGNKVSHMLAWTYNENL